MPTLKLLHLGKRQSWTLDVGEDSFLIGRSRKARVCIRDTSVSKQHVRIEKRGDRYHFQDLGSRNGTLVNDYRRDAGQLADGDELRVGRILITFSLGGPPRAPGAVASVGAAGDSKVETAPAAAGRTQADASATASPERPRLVVTPRPGPLLELPRPAAESPLSPSEAERIGRYAPRPARRPRRASRAARGPERASGAKRALIGCAFAAALGLGVVAGRLWRDEESPTTSGERTDAAEPTPEASPASSPRFADASGGSAQPLALGEVRGAGDEAGASASSLALLLGPRADLRDEEVSARALFRLFLDVAGRPPTRTEAQSFLLLPHEERWARMRELAPQTAGAPVPAAATASVPDAFQRFLGQRARPGEAERVLAAVQATGVEGNADHLGVFITSSVLYSSRDFRRPRSLEQRARSLWVDLLDALPSEQNTKTLTAALLDPSAKVHDVVRVLAHSQPSAAVGPREGDEAEVWARDSFLRFLGRLPTTEERDEALAVIETEKDGWRWVLAALAMRRDYREY